MNIIIYIYLEYSQHLMQEDEVSLAFEKLVAKIINLPKPLPAAIQTINWDDCSELGVKLGLDEESVDDPRFWKRFQAFKKELK